MGLTGHLTSLISDAHKDRLQRVAERTFEQHLNLAVTGLSGSGKTVFITALVHHLLQLDQDNSLPLLEAAAEKRLLGCRPVAAPGTRPFPFKDNLAALSASEPHWPRSTRDLSQIRLAIRYRRSTSIKRLLGEWGTVYLNIIDYPGEWLLDLPMLQQDFLSWSRQQTNLLQTSPRAEAAAQWLEANRAIDWHAPANLAQLNQLGLEFRDLLQSFREPPHALSMLQPGHLLLSEASSPEQDLLLFPLTCDISNEAGTPDGSALAEMTRRYRSYCERWVRPFYTDHFSRFDRQIILTDCLKTLNQGEACFDDMQLALNTILSSFHYGKNSLFRRLFSPRIERVLFAATKADHVTANQHANLDRFLELMVHDARKEMRFESVQTRCMALASVRSTQAAQARKDGQLLSCLKGYRKETGEPVALFPGEIPTELPRTEDWHQDRFRFIDFAPRALPRSGLKPEHHIRLDQALEYLTGDLFR